MKYISIDIETTGLDPEKHQILEFAAVYDDLENLQPIRNLPKFHRLIHWEDYIISDFCLKLHEELLKEIQDKNNSDIITIDRLAAQFGAWLACNGSKGEGYNVAGKNFAGFDGQFLKKIPGFPHWFYRVIDIGSLYLTPGAAKLPGLKDIIGRVEHRAISDAQEVVAAIRNKMIIPRCPNCWSKNS